MKNLTDRIKCQLLWAWEYRAVMHRCFSITPTQRKRRHPTLAWKASARGGGEMSKNRVLRRYPGLHRARQRVAVRGASLRRARGTPRRSGIQGKRGREIPARPWVQCGPTDGQLSGAWALAGRHGVLVWRPHERWDGLRAHWRAHLYVPKQWRSGPQRPQGLCGKAEEEVQQAWPDGSQVRPGHEHKRHLRHQVLLKPRQPARYPSVGPSAVHGPPHPAPGSRLRQQAASFVGFKNAMLKMGNSPTNSKAPKARSAQCAAT